MKMKRRETISALKIGTFRIWKMLPAQGFKLDLDPEMKVGVPELTQILEDHRTELPL
jgi:heat shock protein HspQ